MRKTIVPFAAAALLLAGTVAGIGPGSVQTAYAADCSNNGSDLCTVAPKQIQNNGKTYDLVWADEFNTTELSSDWEVEKVPVENGAMKYANKVDKSNPANGNIDLRWGRLALRAQPTDQYPGKVATSAGIQTLGKKSWKYGRFEARIRLHGQSGTWPALWLMPDENPYGWPKDGEIDWFEYPRSASATQNQTNVHTSNHLSRRGLHDTATTGFYFGNQDLAGSWHVWTMDWDENGFVFYMDGREYSRIQSSKPEADEATLQRGNVPANRYRWPSSWLNPDGSVHTDSPSNAPFDKKFFLIFNLGLKKPGQWAGPQPGEQINWRDAYVEMDYVRVYQTAEQKAEQNKSYLKIDTQGATESNPATKTVDNGTVLNTLLPSDLKNKKGEVVDSWYNRPGLNDWAKVDVNSEINSDLTLFPKWVKLINVTFNAKGHGTAPSAKQIKSGTVLTADELSDDANWKFKGWYLDDALQTPLTPGYKPENDVTLYAKWEQDKVSVTFDNKGHGAVTEAKEVTPGETLELPVLSEANWVFKGWFTNPELTNAVTEPYRPTGNATLYAKWEKATVQVSFDKNGKGEDVPAKTGNAGEAMELPVPTADGWVFKGWFTNSELTAPVAEPYVPTANATLYAKWEKAPTYSVKFEANGHGGHVDDVNVLVGQEAKLPTLSESGWVFKGWFTNSELTAPVAVPYVPTADATLYAKWEKATVQVSFDKNGKGEDVPAKTGNAGEAMELPVPTADGWVFKGWFTNSELTAPVAVPYVPTADATLYAKWEKATVQVTFNKNGHGEDVSSQTGKFGEEMKLPKPAETGWVFKGWFTNSELTAPVAVPYVPTADATLYAKWERAEVKVSFDTRGHSNGVPAVSGKAGELVNLPTPTEDGWIFKGWFLDQNLTNKVPAEYKPLVNATLYAKWVEAPSYTVKFENNGHGTKPAMQSVKQGKKLTTSPLAEDRWAFKGWFLNKELTTPLPADYTVSEDVTLYAKWVQTDYLVSFDTKGHGKANTKRVKVGTSVALPTLQANGWEFKGWFTDSSLKAQVGSNFVPKADTTLYAKWTKVEKKKKHIVMAHAPKAPERIFRDVWSDSPFSGEILWARKNRITTGWPDGTYRPYAGIERNAMAAYLYRLAGSPKVDLSKGPHFKDLAPGDPFYKEITWLAQQKITTGWPDGTYRPLEKISRQAMAAFLYRFAHNQNFRERYPNSAVAHFEIPKGQRAPFVDTKTAPFEHEIAWLAAAKITAGWEDNTFRPLNHIDRNAMAAFLYRLVNNPYKIVKK
ncbi:InlB B-repeat-containing protein [Actinomycetaceae bacterium TAE3-ERU4]|nr:InlB B-repeat-containing protein [Actinomycetaceae bacterium TAE3-ERU4]